MDRTIQLQSCKSPSFCDISIKDKDKHHASIHIFDVTKTEAANLYTQLGTQLGTEVSFKDLEVDLARYLKSLEPQETLKLLLRVLLNFDKEDVEFIKKQVLEYKTQYPPK